MSFKFVRSVFPALLVLVLFGTPLASQAAPSTQRPDPAGLENQLMQSTGGTVRIGRHAKTGQVNYIGTERARPITPQVGAAAVPTPEAAARGFMAQYGALFGLTNQAQELRTTKVQGLEGGGSNVRFQQVFGGVPIVGGEINVNLDDKGNLLAALGEVTPALNVAIKPTVDGVVAQQRAREAIAKAYQLKTDELVASQPELSIYDATLLGGPGLGRPALVWRMEVTPTTLRPIKELVLVDAQRGIVALHFNQIHEARDRKTYTANNGSALPGTLKCVETTTTCSPDETDARLAHLYAGQTYDFYKVRHNRDSINNAGMPLISTVDYCPDSANCPYANAFWDGTQMVYGNTYASADDVVGHELTHGVTEYESHLFYYYQSGAINESFSDIWGEWIDLTNARGNDTATVRWLVGEDLPIGAIRNMKNPGAFGDPDRMRSANYWTSADDGGGVHSNSGVGNKAAFLITDGGTFNGKTVAALGIDKAAKIYYQAQTNLLVSGSDYADLHNALRQACANLVGTAGITTTNCQQVKNAVDATEMHLQPTSTEAQAIDAPLCGTGQVARDVWFDNLENPAASRWVRQNISGANQFYYPQNTHSYAGYDATYGTSGVYNIWGDDVDFTTNSALAMKANVAIPANAFLHFRHAYGFESIFSSYYDGGMLQYSINGGAWQNVPASMFTHNGYNADVSALGARGWGGDSHGYYSSRLNLSTLAGKNVKFRFRLATDFSGADYGWYIDDIRIFTCGA